MPFYSGKDGQLWIGNNKAAKVQSWSFSSSQAVLETTSLEDTDRTVIPGIRSYNGSARLFYYEASAGSGGDVTTLINKCIPRNTGNNDDGTGKGVADESSNVTLTLKIGTGSTVRYISFICFITGISMNSAVGEVLSADIGWEADGAPTDVDI